MSAALRCHAASYGTTFSSGLFPAMLFPGVGPRKNSDDDKAENSLLELVSWPRSDAVVLSMA